MILYKDMGPGTEPHRYRAVNITEMAEMLLEDLPLREAMLRMARARTLNASLWMRLPDDAGGAWVRFAKGWELASVYRVHAHYWGWHIDDQEHGGSPDEGLAKNHADDALRKRGWLLE
jgi:hypothetical protein